MGKEQDLTLRAKPEGFKDTADQIGQVDQATEKLKQKTGEQGKVADDGKKNQDNLNASMEDYVGILNKIHPALGGIVEGMGRAFKVSGDLATKNIDLGSVFKKGTAAALENANALKLIGAGGAVVFAINAIVTAVQKEAQALEDLLALMDKVRNAQNELEGSRADRQQAIEDISDQSRAGPLSAGDAKRLTSTAESISGKFEALDEGAINEVVALLGRRLDQAGLEKAAILRQQGKLNIDVAAPENFNLRRLEFALEKFGDDAQAFINRERAQGQGLDPTGERARQAQQELQGGGSTFVAQKIGKNILPAGIDVERIAKLAQLFGSSGGLNDFENDPLQDIPFARLLGANRTFVSKTGENPTTVELDAIRKLIETIERTAFESSRREEELRRTPANVTQNIYNQRNFGDNGATRRRRTANGENSAKREMARAR